jgi:hypothetical protein
MNNMPQPNKKLLKTKDSYSKMKQAKQPEAPLMGNQ